MAGTSSEWTNLGSNTNSTINTDTAAEANVSTNQTSTIASGTNSQVRHECHMWLVDDVKTYTKSFDWAIDNDFTIVVNSALQTLASDPGNVTCNIEGSIDGTNYVEMRELGTWDAGTATIGQLIYDFDGYGRMPYMRLGLVGSADEDNSAKPIKINIFMHNT